MDKPRAIIIISFIAILSLLLTIIAYNSWKVVSINEYDVTLSVGHRIGFDVGGNNLSFGTTFPGSESSRKIQIKNDFTSPVRVMVKNIGETAKFVLVEKNSFMLGKGQTEDLDFIAKVPPNAAYGNYTGKIIIRTLRA